LSKTFAIGVLLLLVPVLGDVSKAASGGAVESAGSHHAVVVSLTRLALESAEGRAANQRLQALAQKMSTDLAAKQKELPQPAGQDFQRLVQQSQTDFATTQRQVQTEMRTKVNAIVAEIAAQRGVDMVFNADTLVWSATQVDITGEVVSKLDALSKTTSGK
jgi:Skp family chaperone for outer membrane proteins